MDTSSLFDWSKTEVIFIAMMLGVSAFSALYGISYEHYQARIPVKDPVVRARLIRRMSSTGMCLPLVVLVVDSVARSNWLVGAGFAITTVIELFLIRLIYRKGNQES